MNLKGSRVFVTGADGFIGSHLVEALVCEGANVRALVQYNSFNSWGWLDSLDSATLRAVEVFPGDVRDPDQMRQALAGVQAVFHLAALISIPFSYQAPASFVDTNVKGTLNVLQAAREAKTERVLVTSTSEVYGTAIRVPMDESHPLQAQSPYSASKIAADRLAESFYRCYDLPVTIVRPFNTYGPRQSSRAIIPTLITQLLAGSKRIRLGNTGTSRDFNYVADTVRGFLDIAGCDQAIGEEINIASQTEITIGELAKLLVERINPEASIHFDDRRLRPERSEVERLLGSNEKLKRLTGWSPMVDLAKGLDLTIEWFRSGENIKGYKPHVYNI
jgi:NAD dependent epimerase/dehydratase